MLLLKNCNSSYVVGLGRFGTSAGCIARKVYRAVLPVFWGPITKTLGNVSHHFDFDQIFLWRMSSHGFCWRIHQIYILRFIEQHQSIFEKRSQFTFNVSDSYTQVYHRKTKAIYIYISLWQENYKLTTNWI